MQLKKELEDELPRLFDLDYAPKWGLYAEQVIPRFHTWQAERTKAIPCGWHHGLWEASEASRPSPVGGRPSIPQPVEWGMARGAPPPGSERGGVGAAAAKCKACKRNVNGLHFAEAAPPPRRRWEEQ